MPEPGCQRASTTHTEAREAVRDVRSQIAFEPGLVVFFCSTDMDRELLAKELQAAFPCPTVGCTGAGIVGLQGFQSRGLALLAFPLTGTHARVFPIRSLGGTDCEVAIEDICERVSEVSSARVDGWRTFGLLLIDGLSLAEERIASGLYRSLGNVPIVGGSAGDDLSFTSTFVYDGAEFRRDAAVFVLVETTRPFQTLRTHHIVPTDRKLVITAATPELRIVHEIDGHPAREAYARAIGIPSAELDFSTCAQHPVLLRIAGESYVRSVAELMPDGSMRFFCAIDEGMVLSVGRAVDPEVMLDSSLSQALKAVGEDGVVLGCDSAFRRLELEQDGLLGRAGELFTRHRVVGFGTYGEQFNGVHMNQTFTGIAIGGAR